MLRRQPPAYSPVSLSALWSATLHGLRLAPDTRANLIALLECEYAADHVILLGSGTQALQIALRLAMSRVGDPSVALPAFTCFDVASAAVGASARLRFYDVEPSTLAPDLESLERVLERGTRVVVVTPLYGLPVDWDTIDALAVRHGAIVIEDAAQGHHARWRGRPLGSLGSLSVLSFGRGKGLTGGAGGAPLLREPNLWRALEGGVRGAPRRSAAPT